MFGSRQRRPAAWLAFLLCLAAAPVSAGAGDCAACRSPLTGVVFSFHDEVTGREAAVCARCRAVRPRCFVCGLPVDTDAPGVLTLPDERVICPRDAVDIVLREEEALRLCAEARDSLERLLSRFLTLPETNVALAIVDRPRLRATLKAVGRERAGHEALGCAGSQLKAGQFQHQITLLNGLPPRWLTATCVHEYAHAWIRENVPPARYRALGGDAEEGFCELLACLYLESLGDTAGRDRLLRNTYTQGQASLFLDAYRRFGLNDIVDWMREGRDAELSAREPDRIRELAR